ETMIIKRTDPSLPAQNGFVLDWDFVYYGDDAWFSGGTYLVSGESHVASATFSGEIVLKYEPGSSLYLDGPLFYYSYDTVFTTVEDTHYGEAIPEDFGGPYEGEYGPALAVQPEDLDTALNARIEVLFAAPEIIGWSQPPSSTVTVLPIDPIATKGASDTGVFTIARD